MRELEESGQQLRLATEGFSARREPRQFAAGQQGSQRPEDEEPNSPLGDISKARRANQMSHGTTNASEPMTSIVADYVSLNRSKVATGWGTLEAVIQGVSEFVKDAQPLEIFSLNSNAIVPYKMLHKEGDRTRVQALADSWVEVGSYNIDPPRTKPVALTARSLRIRRHKLNSVDI